MQKNYCDEIHIAKTCLITDIYLEVLKQSKYNFE